MELVKKPLFTVEFKEQAVGKVLEGKTISDVSQELGIRYHVLRGWVQASSAPTDFRSSYMELVKKPFTAEFKEQAVGKVLEGKTITEVSQELGIRYHVLRGWVQASSAPTDVALPSTDSTSTSQDEIFRLKVELSRLRRENEIIRKAAAYFARDML
nr:transposase [uncultured Undibacterium sp.]